MKHNMHIHSGLSLGDGVRIAPALGVDVRKPTRTGEILFSHPLHGTVRHSARRKDASRALVVLLRRAARRSA